MTLGGAAGRESAVNMTYTFTKLASLQRHRINDMQPQRQLDIIVQL